MPTSLQAIATKAKENRQHRFFESLPADRRTTSERELVVHPTKRRIWRGSDQREAVRRKSGGQHPESRREAEEQELSGTTGSTSLDTEVGWENASTRDSRGGRQAVAIGGRADTGSHIRAGFPAVQLWVSAEKGSTGCGP